MKDHQKIIFLILHSFCWCLVADVRVYSRQSYDHPINNTTNSCLDGTQHIRNDIFKMCDKRRNDFDGIHIFKFCCILTHMSVHQEWETHFKSRSHLKKIFLVMCLQLLCIMFINTSQIINLTYIIVMKCICEFLRHISLLILFLFLLCEKDTKERRGKNVHFVSGFFA
jgi:hypothetical protein